MSKYSFTFRYSLRKFQNIFKGLDEHYEITRVKCQEHLFHFTVYSKLCIFNSLTMNPTAVVFSDLKNSK